MSPDTSVTRHYRAGSAPPRIPLSRSDLEIVLHAESGLDRVPMPMLKLYKGTPAGLAYHEAWTTDDGITEHWGAVGEEGETEDHPLAGEEDPEDALERILAPARAAGFRELEDDERHVLLIEYAVDGMGSARDPEKRHALEDRMNETLGWTGLGHCDGGSIGSGTMEVCCFVVDFERARAVIQADLSETPFADYGRIFEQT